MKILGFERDNTTLPSTADPWGWHYSASFELYPFHEGKDRAVYKGILNGQGPLRGRFCVVKARLDATATKAHWRCLQECVRKAHALASSFNVLVQTPAISFVWPVMAELETLSDFTRLVRLFKPHDKTMHRGEVVVIEEFLHGKFDIFSSAVGWVNPNSKTDITQAFSHYTWHATHSLVVCGLQGVATGRSFRLSAPTIHSKGRQFGANDGGMAGIMEFFSTHRCNNICSSWPGLDVPEAKCQSAVQVHLPSRSQNRPRRNCNLYNPQERTSPVEYVPKVPSAPVIESTRF